MVVRTKTESDERTQARDVKALSEAAIAYALGQDWAKAAAANRAVLDIAPGTIEALNRLAKALLELREFEQARDAVDGALRLDPANAIARRHRERLDHAESAADAASPGAFSPHLLMSEMGKSVIATLIDATDRTAVGHLSSGEALVIRSEKNRLLVHSVRGEAVGRVHPRLAQRILALMEAGNRYEAAFLRDHPMEGVQVIICEVYQDPSQNGRPSFTSTPASDFRGYIRSSGDLVDDGLGGPPERHDADDNQDRSPQIDDLVRAHDRAELDKRETPLPDDEVE